MLLLSDHTVLTLPGSSVRVRRALTLASTDRIVLSSSKICRRSTYVNNFTLLTRYGKFVWVIVVKMEKRNSSIHPGATPKFALDGFSVTSLELSEKNLFKVER